MEDNSNEHKVVSDFEACGHHCAATPNCHAVVMTERPPIKCYPRRSIDPARCEASTGFRAYNVRTPPAPPRWPPTQCVQGCAANVVPHEVLPVLSASNAKQQADWHSYLERVYHQRLGSRVVDTKLFSWFYNDRKQAVLYTAPCTDLCVLRLYGGPKWEGTPWIGKRGPEGSERVGAFGFFVHRPFLTHDDAFHCERLEVMHAASKWLKGPETGASWFFHTVGSGVFLDCAALRRQGRIVVRQNRCADKEVCPEDAWAGPWMAENGISMFIYLESFDPPPGSFEAEHRNPRTEIIVAHREQGHSEFDNARGACLDDPRIDLPLRTGFDGSLPCHCVPRFNPLTGKHTKSFLDEHQSGDSDVTNCDGSGVQP